MTKIIPFDGVKHADQTDVCCLMVHQIEVLLEPNSHYQTYQRRCDEFQRNNQKQTISYKNRQKNARNLAHQILLIQNHQSHS